VPLLFPFLRRPPSVFSSLSLHDALPIFMPASVAARANSLGVLESGFSISNWVVISCHARYTSFSTVVSPVIRSAARPAARPTPRSEEHTSELQSRFDLVCRLLLAKKTSP